MDSIAVIGLGYVGLPLSLQFARSGVNVFGLDIDAAIVEQLQISNGSASQGLQFLRSLGAVRVVENEGGRWEYLEPELSLRQLVSGVFRDRIAPLATAGAERFARLRALAERAEEAKDFCLDRFEQLETWRHQATLVMPVLKTLLKSPKR